MPMELNTTYNLSYWDGPIPTVSTLKPAKPEDTLTVGEGQITDQTIHKVINFDPN